METSLVNSHAIFTQVVLMRSEVIITKDLAQQALNYLYNRHPLLHMKIVKHSKDYYFEPMVKRKLCFQVGITVL